MSAFNDDLNEGGPSDRPLTTTKRSSTMTTQNSRILAQRSPTASVRSQIQLKQTIVHVHNGIDDNENNEDERAQDGEGSKAFGNRQAGPSDSRKGGNVDEEAEDDDEEDDTKPLTKITVGHGAWDDSDDEESPANRQLNGDTSNHRPRLGNRRRTSQHDYLNSLRPTSSVLKKWLIRLTKSPSAHASLSAPHVTANLFSASLNPAVLLSMPAYFDRTGISLGIVGLVVVAALAGAGGGLWVVLGRYVGGANIEAITAASFGRNTRWKGNVGRTISGLLVACYGTGTAVVAYFALADLLLQVLFHYSPKGIPFHNRLFVTIVVGGIISTPLAIYPLAKRNLIRLSTTLAVFFYPCILAILLSYIYKQPQSGNTPPAARIPPQLNPLHPPSIWAPYSLLPLLSLSSSPLQIIAHNRSLRRTGISGSNVKAFLAAQAAQTFAAIGVAIAFGVGIGVRGMGERLCVEIHPNLFTTLPLTDALNLARILFILILISHLALCLVTVRSAWARLLYLFNLNPFKKMLTTTTTNQQSTNQQSTIDQSIDASSMDINTSSHAAAAPAVGILPRGAIQQPKRKSWLAKRWTRQARDAFAGLVLWAITAFTAYWSGVGGWHLRKGQKNDADDAAVQANFTRAQEVLGLLGAGVGFVLPAFVWIILFHIRQPRAILPPVAAEMARQASAWFLGPQSALAAARRMRSKRQQQQNRNVDSAAERQPLLDDGNDDDDDENEAEGHPNDVGAGIHSPRAFRQSLEDGTHTAAVDGIPSWRNEGQLNSMSSSNITRSENHHQNSNNNHHHPLHETDEATRILLARKERELQRRTRGRRVYQDIIVLAGILPLGISLIVLGALDLRHGGW